MERWETIERPGYFGKKREEIQRGFDERYGEGKWRIAWQWGDLIVPKEMAIQIYEDGYYNYLRNNLDIVNWLVTNGSDVFDTAPSNVNSGFDYGIQETPNNHIHDISVRRSVARLGFWFRGDHLIEIRGPKTEGERLSPHLVPFHLPEMIYRGQIKDYSGKGNWWRKLGIPDSVEEFYQQNKVLQVRES